MRERDREIRRRRHRREKLAKLISRLERAQTRSEKERLVRTASKLAPWNYQQFQRYL
ncbi:MAG: hypothetical protein QN163_08090 [Armatimonadota bacterium]|nr:hypothetical protein [Armatimonadota bacterium]MDR5697665.1 hypothetical protein [Armatimonadota bacterium]